MSGSASPWAHSTHAGEERVTAVSALWVQVPPGAVPGAAVCRPCQLRGRAGGRGGEGAVQAQRCQQAATAQPRPPGQGAEGPHLPPPLQADPRHPSARRRGAACRDTLLSPGSLEPAASCVSTHTVRVDGNHLRSVCPISAGLSPPRANLWEKRDEAEFAAQAPERWGTLLPRQPQAAPSSLLTSPSRTELRLSLAA